MPSPAWRRWPRRAGCGGDPLRIRPGSVERQHPLIRVGGDAHIAPGPDGQDRWDDTYKPPALAPDLPGGCGHPPLRGWEFFATQPGPAYTFMCPLHTRRLRAAPSPSRRGQELFVLGCRKIYGIVTEGNPLVGPHQCALLFAMTASFFRFLNSYSQQR